MLEESRKPRTFSTPQTAKNPPRMPIAKTKFASPRDTLNPVLATGRVDPDDPVGVTTTVVLATELDLVTIMGIEVVPFPATVVVTLLLAVVVVLPGTVINAG